jgi:hypothetical protein
MGCYESSDHLADFSRADTRRTNASVLYFSIQFDGNFLQIGEPSAFARVMSMADTVADDGPFSTDIAFSAHY